MAKPIKDNPVTKGKAAKKIREMVIHDAVPSADRKKQNRKDIQVYLSAKAE